MIGQFSHQFTDATKNLLRAKEVARDARDFAGGKGTRTTRMITSTTRESAAGRTQVSAGRENKPDP